jgi:uncharacterized spore protein YtfJ
MIKKLFVFSLIFAAGFSLLLADQAKENASAVRENPIALMTKAMSKRLKDNMHVKNIVGDPIKVGNITIIPIIMIDIGYGGGEAGGQEVSQRAGGFYMSGNAKPMGFIIISKEGTKFLSVGKAPRK